MDRLRQVALGCGNLINVSQLSEADSVILVSQFLISLTTKLQLYDNSISCSFEKRKNNYPHSRFLDVSMTSITRN